MSKFKVGQQVLVEWPYRKNGPTTEVITKVGRKLVYITAHGWQETGFYIDTGAQRSEFNGARLYTELEWAEKEERAHLVRRLNAHGLDRKGYGDWHQSNETMKKLLAVLDEAAVS